MVCAAVIMLCAFPLSADAGPPTDQDLAACLPDALADLQAVDEPLTVTDEDGAVAVSRGYQNDSVAVEVTVWQLPRGKADLPYFEGRTELTMVVVKGRLCTLDVDAEAITTTLVVHFDKGFLEPPPHTYKVGIVAYHPDGQESVVTALAEALDHDRIFALYDQR
jgi:hypothetical protein